LFKYAQLNVDNCCMAISYLSGEVDYTYMIRLTEEQDVRLGDIYEDGEWTRPDPPEPVEPSPSLQDRVEALEEESTVTMLGLAEVYEQKETEVTNALLATAELYELLLQQQETIEQIQSEINQLKAI